MTKKALTRMWPGKIPLSRARRWSTIAAILSFAPVIARAQPPAPDGQAATIVVTAPSAGDTAPLRDTPANVRSLGDDALLAQGHGNLADLLDANLGAVSLSNGTGSPWQSDLSYRGFQATSLLGSPTGLSVYLDGVRMNEPFGANVNWDMIPMNALAGVEVLPGSNPLFGLNTLGGALVLTTRNGADSGGLEASVEAGSWRRRALRAEAGGASTDKRFDWFLAGNVDDQAGFRLHSASLVKQAFGKLRWRGTSAHAELDLVWAASRLNGTQGLPPAMLATPEAAYTWPDNTANRQLIVNLRGDVRLSRAAVLSGNLYLRRTDASAVNSNASEDEANCLEQGGGPYLCADAAAGGSARDLYAGNPFAPGSAQYAHFTPYAGALPLSDATSAIDGTLVASRVRQHIVGGNLLVDIDGEIAGMASDLNLGGSFEAANITYRQDTTLAALVDYQLVAMASNARYASAAGFRGDPLVSSVAVSASTRACNLFAREMLTLARGLNLTASLALSATSIRLSGANSRFLGSDGGYAWVGGDGQTYANPAYLGAQYWATPADGPSALATALLPDGAIAGPEVTAVSGAHRYHRLNPALGLTWNPAEAAGVFASWSQAMRAPTAIELACANPAAPCALPTGFNGDPELAPVIARTLEIGGRGRLGHRFAWNAAFYRTRLTNDIQFSFTPAGLGYFANVGATERLGMELGASMDGKHWHLAASYGHVRATYLAGFADALGDEVRPGNRIPGIAADSFKLRASISPARAVMLGAGLVAVSGQYAHGDEANRNAPVPGYLLVNLDAHFYPQKGAEVFADVTNLLGRGHASFGVMGGDIYTGAVEQFRTPGPPRAIMVGLRARLGGK